MHNDSMQLIPMTTFKKSRHGPEAAFFISETFFKKF